MNTAHYSFPAICGHQGKSTYYLVQCPLQLVSRLFLFDESEVPPTLHAARVLNANHAKELTQYLVSHPDDYVLAPIVASTDVSLAFEPLTSNTADMGTLRIPLTARIIVHDGQHRRAAIRQAIASNPSFKDDTIAVMLYPDPEFAWSLRLYADLNHGRTRNTQSQQVLYDRDTQLAALIRQLVNELPLFKDLTELEKTTISNRSKVLFTLSTVYQANKALLGVKKNAAISEVQVVAAQRFWQDLGDIIPEWHRAINGEVTTASLRQNYVHVHSVTLLAIGLAGNRLIATYPSNWTTQLKILGQIDWSRRNTRLWEGRAMVRGKISKAHESVQLTANAIKQAMGLELTEQEQALEQKLLGSQKA